MTKTLIEQLEESLSLAETERDLAVANVARVKLELAHARAAQAAHDGHVWAGKAVKRTYLQRGTGGYGFQARTPDRNVTVRGTVTLCTDERGNRYRGHWPQAGEWFVKSASGLTAYKLGEGWELDE